MTLQSTIKKVRHKANDLKRLDLTKCNRDTSLKCEMTTVVRLWDDSKIVKPWSADFNSNSVAIIV